MNSSFHIAPLSVPDDDVSGSVPEFWGADLALRIWLWLSQIYMMSGTRVPSSLAARLLGSTDLREAYFPFQEAVAEHYDCEGRETPHAQSTEPRPSRHQRRMTARRARGIMPITRYAGFYLRPLLPKGLSPRQALEAALRLSPLGRLQIYNWNYYAHDFFKRGAIKARAAMGSACAQISAGCDAPLSPD